jgi:hypothetical protein
MPNSDLFDSVESPSESHRVNLILWIEGALIGEI